ncbi:MAG: hormogonium polysaccharide biosynthesis glycosyltransferase HpsE [Cyanobacteria bacterium J06648_16]
MAIRAHNGEKHLPEIFDALLSQQGLENVEWEVLVVDNCSCDRTAEIVRSYQQQWPSRNPLRYCFESVKGASVARRRAIEEANAPLVGFLDDDNIPAERWVRAAINFAQEHPHAAAFGSQICGKFESPPPENFDHIAGFLPVVERPYNVCFTKGVYDKINMLPPGAGLVIRRQPWLALVPEQQTLQGPVGHSLALKGEDIEALMYLKRAGWQIWFNADMYIYHHIPTARLEREYLMRFFKGIGLSRYCTRTVSYPNWFKPFVAISHLAKDLGRLLAYWFKYHRKFSTDAILASKMELYRSSLISPFYQLKKNLRSLSTQVSPVER